MTLLFISVFVFGLTSSLLFVFRRKCEKDVVVHQQQLAFYYQELQIHKKQINKRLSFIDQYDLLLYNLSEVLIAQDEIRL